MRLERRLAAILAVGVVGYARLMGADEAGTLSYYGKGLFGAVLQPKIACRGGRVVKLKGDGVLAEFPSAVEAVDCAIDARLLDSDDGRQVWGEKFDGDVVDVFEFQDEITRNVVGNIAPKIELAEVARSRKRTGADLTA